VYYHLNFCDHTVRGAGGVPGSEIPTAAVLVLLMVKVKAVSQHTYGGTGGGGKRMYSSYSFTTSALDGDEWLAPCPGRALPLGKGPLPSTHLTEGWVGPRVSLDTGYRKNHLACAGD
jgi:hypothetical protein